MNPINNDHWVLIFRLAEREPQGGSPRVREDPLGTPPPLSLPRKSSENLEEVPRIREGEGPRRSEILNPVNNDYWVLIHTAARPTSTVSATRSSLLVSGAGQADWAPYLM